MLTLVATLPFILLFVLMVILKQPAVRAAPVTLVVVIISVLGFWQMSPLVVGASLIAGLIITLEIILIVFGAIFLLNILKTADAFSPIRQIIETITADARIQAIIIGWFFVGFIEGAAGFGTPAMLAAPLLMMLGFKPLAAVAIALIGDSAAVTFGAVGVPITIGITEGLSSSQLVLLGNSLDSVTTTVAFIHLSVGFLIPLILSVIVTFTHNRSIKKGLAIAPLALIAGFCFLIPSYLAATFLSPEFPSMIGGLIGGSLFIIIIKLKLFLPTKPYLLNPPNIINKNSHHDLYSTLKAFSPYILTLLLLASTRIDRLGIGQLLKKINLDFSNILGTDISAGLEPFYSPGFIFLIAGLLSIVIFGLSQKQTLQAIYLSITGLIKPLVGLLAVLGIVQIILASGYNLADLPSIPLYLAQNLPYTPVIGPLLSPFIGALGSFMAGSSTVSNLLFTSFQAGLAEKLGLSLIIILSLQAAGSAVGNMMAIHNIIAAQAVVGLKDKDGNIIRLTIIPAFIYTLLIGLIGLILLNLL
ncbi:MAG: L-lactate permease [Patescibacteria group bacterium]